MQLPEKYKGLCRECKEIEDAYFDILSGFICSKCGTSIADPFIERG